MADLWFCTWRLNPPLWEVLPMAHDYSKKSVVHVARLIFPRAMTTQSQTVILNTLGILSFHLK